MCVWGAPPSGLFEFPLCVRVRVARRGGPPGGRMGGEGLSVVRCPSRRVRPALVGCLGAVFFGARFRGRGPLENVLLGEI